MKKLFLLGALFAATLAVTSCSSDKDEPGSGGSSFDENGVGYVSIGINLPTDNTAGTRANGQFENGSADEYAVKDVILALFTGTTDSEDDATFVSAYSLDPNTWQTGSGEVTQYKQYTQQLTSATLSTYTYALVIINGKVQNSSSVAQFSVSSNILSCNGTALTVGTTKFSDLKAMTLDRVQDATNGFLMTTAPYSKLAGKTSNPSGTGFGVCQLNNITSNIKQTEAAAQANPAKIYVERAAAKVSVVKATSMTSTVTDGSGLTYGNLYCLLDNYNTKFYPTRHFDASSSINSTAAGWLSVNNTSGNYRFVEEKDYEGGTTLGMYRTTWAEDVNYADLSINPLTYVTGRKATSDMTEVTTTAVNAYCAENTMSDDYMTHAHTTRVIVAAVFNSGTNFCTTADYPTTLLTTSSTPTVETVTNTWITSHKSDLDALVTTWASTYVNTDISGYTKTYSYDLTDGVIKCTFSTTLTDTDIKSGYSLTDATAALQTSLTDAIENASSGLGLKFFKDGLAYYTVRVKHFGDTETLWSGNGSTYVVVYGADDDTRTNNYLGRYGIVRNNWYTITINTIRSLGEPKIPEPGDTPDDIGESFLGVKINILKWGIRNQNEDL